MTGIQFFFSLSPLIVFNFIVQALWPLKTGEPADDDRIALLENKMIDNLNLLENIWLKDKPFLCGDEISISDIVGACEVEQPSKIIFICLK